jgi:iduronate 2-sulfatase
MFTHFMRNPFGFALSLIFFLNCATGRTFGDETSRPNVLMIFIDDLRPSLGCYNDSIAKTPNIDQLAITSRVFQRAYCHQAVCGPSRTSILTGLLPDHTGVWHNRNLFRSTLPDLVTLPQWFKEHGYHTQSMGKVFSGDERELDPVSWSVPEILKVKGWRNYAQPKPAGDGKGEATEQADVPDNGYPDGQLAELAIKTLQEFKEKDKPFFLAVGFFKPHLPFNAPKKYWDMYDPIHFQADAKERPTNAPDYAYPDHLELAGYRNIPKDEQVSNDQRTLLRHGYYSCVSYVDAQVGKLLDGLKSAGLGQNTIVVLLGDHGYSLGEADHWCKDTNFENDTRVPLIIRVPGGKPGPSSALIEYVDIFPTLSELANLTSPAKLDGKSFAAVLDDPQATHRNVVLSQFSRPFRAGNPEMMGYSLRTDHHRYTRWINWQSKEVLAEELYDYTSSTSVTQHGPFAVEIANVVDSQDYNKLRSELREKLDETLSKRVKPVTLPEIEKSSRKKKS